MAEVNWRIGEIRASGATSKVSRTTSEKHLPLSLDHREQIRPRPIVI